MLQYNHKANYVYGCCASRSPMLFLSSQVDLSCLSAHAVHLAWVVPPSLRSVVVARSLARLSAASTRLFEHGDHLNIVLSEVEVGPRLRRPRELNFRTSLAAEASRRVALCLHRHCHVEVFDAVAVAVAGAPSSSGPSDSRQSPPLALSRGQEQQQERRQPPAPVVWRRQERRRGREGPGRSCRHIRGGRGGHRRICFRRQGFQAPGGGRRARVEFALRRRPRRSRTGEAGARTEEASGLRRDAEQETACCGPGHGGADAPNRTRQSSAREGVSIFRVSPTPTSREARLYER